MIETQSIFENDADRRPEYIAFKLVLGVIAALLAAATVAIAQAPAVKTPPPKDTTAQVSSSVPPSTASAPDATPKKFTFEESYAIHQSYDLGGHLVGRYGSGAMYDTLVNLRTGPRILNNSLQMNALPKGQHLFFDSLFISNSGYGGDPNNSTLARASKGKIYDFQGMFRRDRQYFDYDLLGNPLVTPGSTVTATTLGTGTYTFPLVNDAPHLFNTLRRMTDLNITLFPVSLLHVRAGYSKNIMQGPSYSSIHEGIEGLLLQNWRTSTDTYMAAVDWKPLRRTTLTVQEQVTHFKGNTSDQLAGLNYQLTTGVPVSLGFDNATNHTTPACTGYTSAINNATTTPVTVNPSCSGYIAYTRNQPTRSIFPTEEFRFQSAYWEKLQMNGRVMYTGGNSHMPNFYDYFNGLGRGGNRSASITGFASAERIDVTGDYGVSWQATKKITISDQYDFANWRQPGINTLSEVDITLATATLLTPLSSITPSAPAVTTNNNYLGMKTQANTILANWQAAPRASFSIGYRYRVRNINVTAPISGLNTTAVRPQVTINENTGLLGIVLQPTPQWKVNFNFEGSYADKSYVQIAPRQVQHYQLRSTYKPKSWAYISGTFNDLERRDNVTYVNHLDHSRSATISANIAPTERYGFDASYGYSDVYSSTSECYLYLPTGVAPAPAAGCSTAYPMQANAYFDSPTQFGDFGTYFEPVKKLRTDVGYRISSVSGNETLLNPQEPLGSLDSQYHTPYAKVAWSISPTWSYRGEWNYYGYGEGGAIGPTAARAFHANVYTISMHYEF